MRKGVLHLDHRRERRGVGRSAGEPGEWQGGSGHRGSHFPAIHQECRVLR